MASLLREFADFTASRGHGTIGTTIFGEEPNPDVDTCLWMVNDPADEPDRYLDTYYANIGVWGRNNSAETGRLALRSLKDDLHRFANFALPSYHIYFCHVIQDVVSLDQDDQRRHIHKMTFRLILRETASVS